MGLSLMIHGDSALASISKYADEMESSEMAKEHKPHTSEKAC